jgi:hypothetical protein
MSGFSEVDWSEALWVIFNGFVFQLFKIFSKLSFAREVKFVFLHRFKRPLADFNGDKILFAKIRPKKWEKN